MEIIATYCYNDDIQRLTNQLYFKSSISGLPIVNPKHFDKIKLIRIFEGWCDIVDDYYITNFDHVKIIIEVDELYDGMFQYCYGLKCLDLQYCDNIYKIPDYFCHTCITLESIRFPKNMREIGRYSFNMCNFEDLDLSHFNTLKINECAFILNEKLRNVTLPKNIYLGRLCFAECFSLWRVNRKRINEFKTRSNGTYDTYIMNDESLDYSVFYYCDQDKHKDLPCDQVYCKYIITEDNNIIFRESVRHFGLMEEGQRLFYGGGYCNFDEENGILNLYGTSEAMGDANIDAIYFDKIDNRIKKVIYNDNVIFERQLS